MKGRSKTRGEPVGAGLRRTLRRKSRSARKTERRRRAPDVETEVARLAGELEEAREQQTATGDVLKIISHSSFDLQAVLDTLVKLAARLCEADLVAIHHQRDDVMQFGARFGLPQEWEEITKRNPIVPGRGTVTGRVLLVGKTVQISDVKADPEYTFTEGQKAGGFRTVLGAPLEREGEIIGAIVLARKKVHPFTDRQIELVKNFAAQAVIAIENARLLNELRESLEQQTATSEVLRVISSSPGELQPVFDAMLEKAVRICDAKFGILYLHEEGRFRLASAHDVPRGYAKFRGVGPIAPVPGGILESIIKTGRTTHLPDLAAIHSYAEAHPLVVAAVEVAGMRSIVGVPMLRENELVGVISIYRQEVRPFTEKQIEFLENFAAQAVIAIENARLLNELRQRTTDLTEALEQQTATSEVLQVVSSSPGDLQPVFTTMLENAVRICNANLGSIHRWDGEAFHFMATHNAPRAFVEVRGRSASYRPHPKSLFGRIVETKAVVHLADAAAEQVYIERLDSVAVAAVELGGVRSVVGVPMLKENELIGAFAVSRRDVRPFTDKQIELVRNFAAQAVIAIENARLLNELRERTSQLEAQSHEVVKLNRQLEQRVADQVGEIERMGRLRRFLPPQVADLIVASGTERQLEGHRQEITALFCDLRGFTGFSESSDPEDVMALLRDYHAAIGRIIIKYSGTLERFAGDGVMVVFNDPVPVENPALQAVLMALEMRDAIGALTEKWRRLGHDIGFGIGIAHGFATLGTIGFEGRFDYAAIGTVSNVASRLCDEAKPGQILITPRVLMAVENAVNIEPVGEFALKGIRRPLAAYNVIAAQS